jgi:hypothetical protein
MTFAKPEKKNDHFDEEAYLNCTHPGCTKRWSVMMERRLCSYHAWSEDKPSYPPPKPMEKLIDKLTNKPIPKNYYDVDEEF